MAVHSTYSASRGLNDDALLNTKEAAKYLNLQPCTLEKWRSQKRGPKAIRLGTKAIRYRKSALDTFIQGGGHD